MANKLDLVIGVNLRRQSTTQMSTVQSTYSVRGPARLNFWMKVEINRLDDQF
jgi:hypothetical protein